MMFIEEIIKILQESHDYHEKLYYYDKDGFAIEITKITRKKEILEVPATESEWGYTHDDKILVVE